MKIKYTTALLLVASCRTFLWAQTLPSAPVYSYSVPSSGGYSLNGNIASFSDQVTGSWSMQYDNLNRLQNAASSSGYYNGLTLQWQYDSFGNRLSQTPSGTFSVAVPEATSATYDQNNRTVSGIGPSLYDAAGNATADGNNYIAYDAESRICAVLNSNGTLTQYLYDAEGQRIAKGHSASGNTLACPKYGDFVADQKYILGQNGEQVTQLNTVNGTDQWDHSNVWAGGQLLATYDRNPAMVNGQLVVQPLHFSITDALGTKRVQTSATGTPELTFASLPYGDGLTTVIGSGTDATEHHFTGKEHDTESQLDFFGARYYPSSTGHWMSPDPAGIGFADAENPQSLNLYAYANNNPLSFVDPNGMLACGSGATPTATHGGAVQGVINFFHAIGCAVQDTVSTVGGAVQAASNSSSSGPPGAATRAPSPFQQLWNNYPTYSKYPTFPSQGHPTFWEHAGGHVQMAEPYHNSCSLRMCAALNSSGFKIPYGGTSTISDANHNWNYQRLTDLQPFLIKTFGQPRHFAPNNWRGQLAGRTGVIMWQVSNRIWSDATGHVTLWDGTTIRDAPDDSDKAYGVLFWPIQ